MPISKPHSSLGADNKGSCSNLALYLEKENELNDCINEMVEFNDQIHYVKEIKDKYKK